MLEKRLIKVFHLLPASSRLCTLHFQQMQNVVLDNEDIRLGIAQAIYVLELDPLSAMGFAREEAPLDTVADGIADSLLQAVAFGSGSGSLSLPALPVHYCLGRSRQFRYLQALDYPMLGRRLCLQ